MTFEEYRKKIVALYKKRGLYENSTERAQIAYGLDEVTEALEELDRGDLKAFAMELIDVATFIVNAAEFHSYYIVPLEILTIPSNKTRLVIELLHDAVKSGYYNVSLGYIFTIFHNMNLDFEGTLDLCYMKNFNRKGSWFDGKWVKYESMTEEQREGYKEKHG